MDRARYWWWSAVAAGVGGGGVNVRTLRGWAWCGVRLCVKQMVPRSWLEGVVSAQEKVFQRQLEEMQQLFAERRQQDLDAGATAALVAAAEEPGRARLARLQARLANARASSTLACAPCNHVFRALCAHVGS